MSLHWQNPPETPRNPPELLDAGKVVKEALDTFASTLKRTDAARQPNKEVDDCDLYAQLMAKKMRKMSEENILKLMLDIDGMVLRHQYGYESETQFFPMRSSPSPSYFPNSPNQFQRLGTSASSYSNSAVHYTPKTIKIINSKNTPSTESSNQSMPASYNYFPNRALDVGTNILIHSNEQIYPPVVQLPDPDEYQAVNEPNIIEKAFNIS